MTPENGESILSPGRLSGISVFLSHGRHDELIPVEQAHRSLKLLKEAGAKLTYCESYTGHKVSKECIKEMGIFLEEP
jgi:predicted esterase